MRTIKFRGKDIETGKWVYGFYVCLEDISRNPIDGKERITHRIYTGFADSCASQDGYDFSGDWHEIAPETVGQFTSLYDRHKKEIYDGDLLKFWDDDTGLIEVRFVRGVFAFLWQGNLDDEMPINAPTHEWATVVGNIHDNPELMKGGEK